MDNSIIFTSTVKIAQSLHMDKASLSWVSNAYTITFGGFLLLAGRLGDLLGRKRIFLSGLVLFGISSLCIGLAQNSIQIITFRAIQVLVRRLLHLQHSLYLWAISKVRKEVKPLVTTAPLLVLVQSLVYLGGWLTSTISWRSGFLINVPFTIILIILTLLL